LWRKLERSKSLVLLHVGGLTCRWQRHSVKPSCWECSTTVDQAETQTKGCSADWRRFGNINIIYLLLVLHLTDTPKCEVRDSHSGLAEDSGRWASCCWCFEGDIASIFRFKHSSSSWIVRRLKMRAVPSFKTPAVPYPATRRHIPNDPHPGRYDIHGNNSAQQVTVSMWIAHHSETQVCW
jgi:hypothetical protein